MDANNDRLLVLALDKAKTWVNDVLSEIWDTVEDGDHVFESVILSDVRDYLEAVCLMHNGQMSPFDLTEEETVELGKNIGKLISSEKDIGHTEQMGEIYENIRLILRTAIARTARQSVHKSLGESDLNGLSNAEISASLIRRLAPETQTMDEVVFVLLEERVGPEKAYLEMARIYDVMNREDLAILTLQRAVIELPDSYSCASGLIYMLHKKEAFEHALRVAANFPIAEGRTQLFIQILTGPIDPDPKD